jgi:hypothetical protein
MSSGYTPFGSLQDELDTCVVNSLNGVESRNIYAHAPGIDLGFEHMISDDSPTRKWKHCQHYKRVVTPGSGSTIISAALNSFEYGTGSFTRPRVYAYNTFGPISAPFDGLNSMYNAQGVGGFVPPPPSLDRWLSRAMSSMMPIIKPQLSLVNSIIELKDFHSLPGTISSVLKWLTFIRGFKGTMRQFFQVGSDAYLQARFNILPTLSDISGIHAALTRSQAKLNRLTSEHGKRLVKHWSHSFQEEYAYADFSDGPWNAVEGPPLPFATMDARMSRSVFSFPTEVHVMIDYSVMFSQYELENARILGLLDELGVNLNPNIIWNAIPFSFVIDWLFKVSKYLDQFKMSNLEPQINIHQGLWSVKRKRTTALRVQTRSRQAGVPAGGTNLVASVFEESFRRDTFMPTSSSLITSGLSADEFSLGAALIVPRRRPH